MTNVEKLSKILNEKGATHFQPFIGESLVRDMTEEEYAGKCIEMIESSQSGETIHMDLTDPTAIF